ncbi:hypothetical protein GCM10007362_14530 [Saccharibacillus endophyticus]|uniref:Uncharacterized protein n=1 Tax=Saccharibacillus endophyticus TaxID=2060666 RepID=A0ABQ1ZR28_9BACL|nr:hypothetical protein GCM10007362_14530 [Saccharibacillus endophyticus]
MVEARQRTLYELASEIMRTDGGTSGFYGKDVRSHRLIPVIGYLSERLVR